MTAPRTRRELRSNYEPGTSRWAAAMETINPDGSASLYK